MKALITILFLFSVQSFGSDCEGNLIFAETPELEGMELSVLTGYEIAKAVLEQMKEVEGIFCDRDIKVTTSTSDHDYARLVRSTLKINTKFLTKLAITQQEEAPIHTLYIVAFRGVIAYLNMADSNNTVKTGHAWYGAEFAAAIGSKDQLKLFNDSMVQKLVEEDPLLAFGLGVYRVLTGKELRTDNPDGFSYKQKTHPTPYEISEVLRKSSRGDLADKLDALTLEYEYEASNAANPKRG